MWILSENILRLFVGFFVGVYVARYLGPDEFGVYNYCLAILTILTPILKLGLDNILVKEFVNRHHEKKRHNKNWSHFKGRYGSSPVIPIVYNILFNIVI